MLQSSSEGETSCLRYALCVGIGTYTNLVNRNLRYAVADAEVIARRLAERGDFAIMCLTEPTQTTKATLEKAVEDLLSAPERQAEDFIVLYFSCHGDINKTDNTFILLPSNATHQTNGTFDQSTVINISDLATWFSRARTRNIVLFLDVCHSGGAGVALQHFKLHLDANLNIFIIGAARQDRIAEQSSQLEHGIFTHCLLRAFGQPPTKDGWLTISQIQEFVSDDISWFSKKDHPLQIQVSSVYVNPLLPLVRNPGYPELFPLPPLWNVPLPRNPFFTGQEDLLFQLATSLQSKQKTALTQPQAISGLGGIGKTQLALEYAYRHRQNYHAILWGRADTYEALISTFVSIAHLLNLSEKDNKDQMVIVKAVKAWLAHRSQWLFVLDNADELALVKEFIPPAFKGHLLLTTRAQTLGELAHKLEVKVMPSESGALFLLRRSRIVAQDASLEAASLLDVAKAREIAEELGGLPLALDQAGAYIDQTQCDLTEYQNIYRTHRAKLLSERGRLASDHPEPVATTWSLSFQRVELQSLAAADLLRFCAYLAPDAIAEEILTADESVLGPLLAPLASDAFQRNQAIEVLRAYSLVRRDRGEKTLSVHRLVQAVLQDTLEENEQRTWAKRAILALNSAFPYPEYGTSSRCERLLAQALITSKWIERYRFMDDEAAHLLYNLAYYLLNRARYSEAEPLFEHALQILEQDLGPDHPLVAAVLSGLANVYKEQGKYTEAEPLYKRALQIWEKSQGPDHPQVASTLNGLANVYKEQGKYTEAEPLYKRTLQIWEKSQGPDHPNVAYALNGLANVYKEQGKYTEAEPLYKRTLQIWEKNLGPDHPLAAYALNGLANVYKEQGKYTEAEPLYKRALHIREESLGHENPLTISVRKNYTLLLWAMKRDMEATELEEDE